MKKRNWFWGIFFILATILLIASQLGSFVAIGFWSLLATIVLVAIIVQSCVYRAWPGIFVPLALLYLIFQTPLGWPYLAPWILIIAAILLSIGFQILFRSRPCNPNNYTGANIKSDVSDNNDDNHPIINLKFGNVVRYLRSTAFTGGEFSCHFGAIEVYFDHATLSPQGAELFLNCHFGAIKLFVPRNWPVENRTQGSMGALEFKNSGIAQPDHSLPKLVLTGSINMAGVEVFYI